LAKKLRESEDKHMVIMRMKEIIAKRRINIDNDAADGIK
jgi:hypothetical protein